MSSIRDRIDTLDFIYPQKSWPKDSYHNNQSFSEIQLDFFDVPAEDSSECGIEFLQSSLTYKKKKKALHFSSFTHLQLFQYKNDHTLCYIVQ